MFFVCIVFICCITLYLVLNDYEINGKIILHVYVPEGSTVYTINHSKIYDRNEDGDYEITNNTSLIANLYLRKSSTYIENKIYPYATIDDLRSDIIAKVRQMAVNRYSKHPWGNMSDIELLKSASLYEKNIATGEEGINLAGILLFGRDEVIKSALSYYKTDAILRVENVDRYDDRDDIRTNLIDSYDRLMDFVIKHLNDKFYLEEDKRIDVRSKIAREICANMLIHREFSNPFPARLIITKDAIYTENANKPRSIGYIDLNNYVPYPKNPKIGNVFKEAGLADELGSGIRNIVKYTKIYSNNIPTFEDGDIFKVTIPLTSVYSRDEIKIKIYDFIASHDGVTRKEINNYIYPHLETNLTLKEKDNIVRYIITQLKNENKIVKEGMKSNVFWKKVD